MREELPPVTQFLNRVLALRIALQNRLFAVFEELLDARIEAAIGAGIYDLGVETLTAESFRIVERRTVYTHAATGAETACYRVLRRDRNRPLPLADALALAATSGARLVVNEQSHRAAVQVPAASLMLDDGQVQPRTRLVRPMARDTLSARRFRPLALARSYRSAIRGAVAGRMREGAGIRRQRVPHHHRPVVADLGPAAVAQHARLPLRDR